MAKTDLTAQRLRELLHYDPETGVFTQLFGRASGRFRAGRQAGGKTGKAGYIGITADGFRYYAHRAAWLYMTGEWPTHQIDHIDRDRSNNIWGNLRSVTNAMNAQNRAVKRGSASGFIGVQKNHGGWQACIAVGGKRINLGTRNTPEEAHALYMQVKMLHHPSGTI